MEFRFLLIVVLMFTACKEMNNSKSPELDIQDWAQISIHQNGFSYSFKKDSAPVGVSPFSFYIDKSEFESFINAIKSLRLSQDPINFDLTRAKASQVYIKKPSSDLLIEGFSEDNEFFLKVRSDKKFHAGKVDEKTYQSIFKSFLDMRSKKIVIPSEIESITYLNSKRVLTKDQKQRFLSLIKEVNVQSYLEDNVRSSQKGKNLGIGVYQNENLKSGIEIRSKGRSFNYFFGRPEVVGNRIRIWSSLNNSIVEGQTQNWSELKRLEVELE